MRAWFEIMDDSTTAKIHTGETSIFVRSYGSGPPILLLHGFPQTHLMWRSVAPLLARNFTVVCADLRGYGRSGCPVSDPNHAPYAKRSMAQDMVTVMERLGFPRFSVAGHADDSFRDRCQDALGKRFRLSEQRPGPKG
jgi:haloacetate dehalogenase